MELSHSSFSCNWMMMHPTHSASLLLPGLLHELTPGCQERAWSLMSLLCAPKCLAFTSLHNWRGREDRGMENLFQYSTGGVGVESDQETCTISKERTHLTKTLKGQLMKVRPTATTEAPVECFPLGRLTFRTGWRWICGCRLVFVRA